MDTNVNKDWKKRAPSVDLDRMVYGKVPPQAKEFEQAVLGAILLEKHAYDAVSELLTPECFYTDAHQKIYGAMQRLSKKSQPLDSLTVSEELRTSEDLENTGGRYYLDSLTNHVVSSAHIESHSKIIMQKFVQREIIRISGELIGLAYEDVTDPFETLDEAQESFGNIGNMIGLGDMLPVDVVLLKTIRKIDEWRENYKTSGSAITGVPSGIADLDRATRGWQNGDLIILAARPSIGKTALALTFIRNAAQWMLEAGKNESSAIWSLEMKSYLLMLRMLSAESKEILYSIQTGRIDDEGHKRLYSNGIQKLAMLKIFFDDNPGLTLSKLRTKARKLKRKNKLRLIVVDYLQLMSSQEKRNSNREQEVSQISRGLKMLAQELDIPIIALSQMSREFEKREGAKRIPQLSDLRESGSLEQDADVVLFLWGPTDAEIQEDASLLNKRFIRIAKQRNGMLVKVELDFKDEIQFFSQASKLPELNLGSGWRPVTKEEKDEDPF